MVVRLLVTGVGLALFNSANAGSLMGAAALRHRGQASATMALARNTGQSVGQALWGTLWGVLAAGILGVATVGNQPLEAAFDAFSSDLGGGCSRYRSCPRRFARTRANRG